MAETPTFFVPDVEPSDYENQYERLAKYCKCAVPDLGRRIYSITFENGGEEWTATVGERVKGKKTSEKDVNHSEDLFDSAVVWAIFPDSAYTIVTNSLFDPGVSSNWENPFIAGTPKEVAYFQEGGV